MERNSDMRKVLPKTFELLKMFLNNLKNYLLFLTTFLCFKQLAAKSIMTEKLIILDSVTVSMNRRKKLVSIWQFC